ncbi:bile acid:sodium symporter [Aurantiacibacter marinus]|uniref:Bile acid:sodium symporter n=1 Tax=Aurantiacibacter marinus TaxID=874156 RepID=A0A0H0XN23_9SPHN|nr:bile acid:sodium symporter [Aurantiacibacter marinus]KLI63769.1 hypothetical protein AAV99_08610 [Aurantiacibacter marinus]
MLNRVQILFDPLVRLLLLAILLASFLPVTGEGRAIAQGVSNTVIFLLFLLNGLRLPRAEVLRGLGNRRFLLPLVLWVFAVMGLAGWAMADLAGRALPASIAVGFVFLGLLPSTVQSATAYTSLAGGNVAHSVVAAATLNILGVFISAPLIIWLANSGVADGNVGFDIGALQRIGLILLLPFVIGQILQNWFGSYVAAKAHIISWMDRFAIAIAVYVAFSSAVEQGVWTLIALSEWGILLGIVGVMLAIGFGGSWWLGGALRLELADRKAFLFAGAQKSIVMGAPLATILFPPEMAGLALLPVLLYHLLQMVISAPLASRFRSSQS